ncbi:MAG: multicopper oxidase family protein [Gammaproteobacteria bacterium]|nr:multicopper oxidase family protein [Gammaproteobacteria bacterium]
MKIKKTVLALSVSIALTTLAGCGGDGSQAQTLSGSVFKGPIDNATIRMTDTNGTVLASGGSNAGLFQMEIPDLEGKVVFIESLGGSYTDEASGETVNPNATTGLMTVFTTEELNSIIKGKQHIAMTPETTLLAKMVKQELAKGGEIRDAIQKSSTLIQAKLIDGTTPLPVSSGDEILRTGNLTSTLPANQKEALARNRAISFSYEAQSMNLKPGQIFELIDTRVMDLEDGKLDGQQNDRPLQITDRDGRVIELKTHDQKNSYYQARAKLFNNTMDRFMAGNISDDEKAELENMGMDLAPFEQMQQQSNDATEETAANLIATNLPDFIHLSVMTDEDGNPDDAFGTYTLNPEPNVQVPVRTPGESWTTPMLRYNGKELPPVIRASRGDKMTLPITNNLDEETTIHWHGFKIPGEEDGGPDFPIAANESRTYSFTINQPAASLWFHPHPHEKTAEQVYFGLAGLFLIDDEISRKLETDKQLPAGDYDIPLLIQDRRFKEDNGGVRELAYKTRNEDEDGNLGDVVLVNGIELPKLAVESRQYRFRIYNTSNARTMDIALSNGAKFHVVGTDGGLLPEPVETDHVLLGAAERAEIVIDFGAYSVDDKVMLVSRKFNGNQMMGMGGNNMGGMTRMVHNSGGMGSGDMGSGGMENMDGMADMMRNGQRFDIMRFDITTEASDEITLYDRLPETAEIHTRLTEADATEQRNFVMSMGMGNMNGGGMTFLINDKTFDMDRVDELVKEGATEIWAISNTSPMAHPFHAHAIQWQILDRDNTPASGVDLGWKDTVLVQPGETVRFIGRFDPIINKGKYMYHCHILEHEDAGMMGTFEVQ